jgi:hypothetical protein
MKNFQMDLNIKVNLKMVLNAERVYFSGLMEKFIKGNGKVEKNMEVEFGKAQTDKVISENGNMERLKVLESLYLSLEIDMKVSFKILKSKVLELRDILMDKLM